MPISAIGEPSGPMLNGTTYSVRPRIEPANLSCRTLRISSGSRQLFVGPASSSDSRADERAVLDARDVARVAARQVGVRPLGLRELLERPRLHELGAQRVVLLRRAVAPVDRRPAASAPPPPPPRRAACVCFVGTVVSIVTCGFDLSRIGVCQVATNLPRTGRPIRRVRAPTRQNDHSAVSKLTRCFPGTPPDERVVRSRWFCQ